MLVRSPRAASGRSGRARPGEGAESARLGVRGHDDLGQLRAVRLELGEQRGVGGVDDRDPGGRVTQYMTGVVAAGRGVERDQDAPAGGHREPGNHELGAIRHHDRDPVAGPDPGAEVAGE